MPKNAGGMLVNAAVKAFVIAFGMYAALVAGARAEFPERPITIIVAYDAGGATDVVARLLAPHIEKQLGRRSTVVVANRPGAGGEIGFSMLADAAPDGYTLGFINSPNVLTIPIQRQSRFGLDSFDPLVNVVDDPGVWTVPSNSPFQNVSDVLSYAKANPRAVTVGSTGLGSDDHLAVLMVQKQAEVGFAHVPFPGSGANHRAMLNRKIHIAGQNLGEATRFRQCEPIRILGVMSDRRSDIINDVPTFKEQELPVLMTSLRGIAAPKGLPEHIRSTLVEALTKAVNDPDFIARAAARDTYQPLRFLGPDAFARELSRMDAEYRALWQQSPWVE